MNDLLEVSGRFGVGEATAIVEEVRTAIGLWPKLAKDAGVASEEIKRIGKLHLLLKK